MTGIMLLTIGVVVVYILILGLAWWVATECEGLRWTEGAYRNGGRVFFHDRSFLVREYPIKKVG